MKFFAWLMDLGGFHFIKKKNINKIKKNPI